MSVLADAAANLTADAAAIWQLLLELKQVRRAAAAVFASAPHFAVTGTAVRGHGYEGSCGVGGSHDHFSCLLAPASRIIQFLCLLAMSGHFGVAKSAKPAQGWPSEDSSSAVCADASAAEVWCLNLSLVHS